MRVDLLHDPCFKLVIVQAVWNSSPEEVGDVFVSKVLWPVILLAPELLLVLWSCIFLHPLVNVYSLLQHQCLEACVCCLLGQVVVGCLLDGCASELLQFIVPQVIHGRTTAMRTRTAGAVLVHGGMISD